MLSAADNELLTRVSPGTQMGDYMRPILGARDASSSGPGWRRPGERPRTVHSLVVFRSRERTARAASTRHAPIASFPRSRTLTAGDLLTCLYHGLDLRSHRACATCRPSLPSTESVAGHGGGAWPPASK